MADPLSELRLRALLNIGLAGLLIFLAFKIFGRGACIVLPLVATVGLYFAGRNILRLIRIGQVEHESLRQFQEAMQQQLARATLPRQVFMLLLAVAEADGATNQTERELVRQFVLQRFTNPVDMRDLRSWEAMRIPPEQAGALALNMRRILSDSECETVFTWCCLVAFVDDSFNPEEHILLQQIARNFDLESHHARRLFHHAKQLHMRGETGGAGAGPGAGSGGRSRATGRVTDRQRALEVLGLDASANEEQVRARHRELVKKYHPDKHAHLGPVAAKEAEERFREVQSAYEVLVG